MIFSKEKTIKGIAVVLSLCLGMSMFSACGKEETEITEEPEIEELTEEEETIPEELYKTITAGDISQMDVNQDVLDFINVLIEKELEYGFSGLQLVVVKDGQMVIDEAWGNVNGWDAAAFDDAGNMISEPSINKESAEVTTDTLFDLASNSKMFATNFAIQKLVYDGELDINKKVCEYIPEFKDREGEEQILGKTEITVKDLLCHQAGFPADPCYHNPQAAWVKDYPDLYCHERSQMLQKIIDTPLKYEPRTETEYSDVDYMLLGFIVEEITGKSLDEYVKTEFYDKMGLTHTTYNPLENGFSKDDCAATELNGNTRQGRVSYEDVRTDTVWGEVHDEKAFYCMEGVSGHAGLFSNAEEIAMLCQVMLNGGGYGNETFFDQATIDKFVAAKNHNDSDWGLGWWRKDNNDTSIRLTNFGAESGDGTYGHTGWTGTITSIDPENNLIIVYLTNRKNSPVINNQVNSNDFVSDNCSLGALGLVDQLVYQAFTSSEESFEVLLADLLKQRIEALESHYGKYDEWPHVQDTIIWTEAVAEQAVNMDSQLLKNVSYECASKLSEKISSSAAYKKSYAVADNVLPGLIEKLEESYVADCDSRLNAKYASLDIGTGDDSEIKGPRKTIYFPSRLGESSMYNMVLQELYGFEGKVGEGKLYITVNDGESASNMRIFINGNEIDCSKAIADAGNCYVIDFSKFSKDGVNTLQVTGFDSEVEDMTGVEVIIPKQ